MRPERRAWGSLQGPSQAGSLGPTDTVLAPKTGRPPPSAGPRRPAPAAKEPGCRGSREPAGKGTQGAEPREERAKGAPTREPPKPGWTLTREKLAAMHPAECHRHLLFSDLLDDVGAAASIFPRESVEVGYRMPDLRAWMQSLELPAARQDRLLGVLRAAEARGRVRALRLRYYHMRVRRGAGGGPRPAPPAEGGRGGGPTAARGGRAGAGTTWRGLRGAARSPRGPQAEEIALLLQQQKSARAALRLELFLPRQLRPTRIPDPLDRQEVPASPGRGGEGARPPPCTPGPSPCAPQRRRVETMLEDNARGGTFRR